MDNRAITNTFLKFKEESSDKIILVSIDSILNSGYPIDAESGEDLELVDDNCYDNNGDPV